MRPLFAESAYDATAFVVMSIHALELAKQTRWQRIAHYLTTTVHKLIGKMYLATSFVLFLVV